MFRKTSKFLITALLAAALVLPSFAAPAANPDVNSDVKKQAELTSGKQPSAQPAAKEPAAPDPAKKNAPKSAPKPAPKKTAPKSAAPKVEYNDPLTLEVEKYFMARDWKALDDLIAGNEKLSPRALSLAANSLWYRSRWADALAMMERVGDAYPKGVVPYAKLLTALGRERTNDCDGARAEALALVNNYAEYKLACYYAMSLLSRLSDSVKEKEQWLRRILSGETNKSRRGAALDELNSIGRMTPTDALQLLRTQPRNSGALKIAARAPDGPEKFYRLGYAAYLRGDNKGALPHLSRLKLSAPYGESGTYYRAVVLQRLNRSPEAVPLLESLIHKKDSDYILRSLSRLRLMQGGKADAAAYALLQKLSQDKNPVIAAGALNALATSGWKTAAAARDKFLQLFPNDSRAENLRFARGWALFRAGSLQKALDAWGGGSAPRLLYWRAKLLAVRDELEKAQTLVDKLLTEQPLTIYAFLADPDVEIEITDDPLPKSLRPAASGELEHWGFMTHAKMLLDDKKDTPSRAHRAELACWLGQDWEAYRDLHSVAQPLLKGNKLSRALLEIEFPRPFKNLVEAAGKKYSVDPLFIWSIMKQESAFDPNARSWVGAAGLMQMMPATAAGEAKTMGLKNYRLYAPEDNINMGASHIAGLISRFKRLDWVAAAYNAGGGNVNKWNRERADWTADAWMEAIPFRETNGYVKNVLRNYHVYQRLYPKTQAATAGETAPEVSNSGAKEEQ